ncbi:MAG: hypothetical protein AAGI30_13795 [Planctomycetota bacterium]
MAGEPAAQHEPNTDASSVRPSDELALLLTASLPCIECGYELKGLSVTGECPECGTAVRVTLAHAVGERPITQSDTPTGVAADGAVLVAGGTLLSVLGLGCSIAFSSLAPFVGLPGRDPFFALAMISGLIVLLSAGLTVLSLFTGYVSIKRKTVPRVSAALLAQTALGLFVLSAPTLIGTWRWGIVLLFSGGIALSAIAVFTTETVLAMDDLLTEKRRLPRRQSALPLLGAIFVFMLGFGLLNGAAVAGTMTELVSWIGRLVVTLGFVLTTLGFFTLTRDAYIIRQALRNLPRTLDELTTQKPS